MASTRRIRVLLGGIAAAAALLALPAIASAGVTCTLSSGQLDVTVTAGTTEASIQRGTGGGANDINVYDGGFAGTLQACTGSPTVTNTDTILVVDSVASQNTNLNIGLQNGALEPGVTTEGTGTSEIEVSFNAGDGPADNLRVFAGSSPDVYRSGSTAPNSVGVDVNNDDDVDDVTSNEGERLVLNGGAGNDDLSANGGAGFTGAVPYSSGGTISLQLTGGPDDDQVTAGPGGWTMDFSGSSGNDVMTGGVGTDFASMDSGNDTADGGGGTNDLVSYQFASGGVHFDLGITGQQDTVVAGLDAAVNFEGIVGSQDAVTGDVLIGDGQANLINANLGDDLLIGKGGDDMLNGNLGTDTASYAVGSSGPVTVSLGTAAAQATGGAGMDTLTDGGDVGTEPDIENLVGSPFAGDVLTGNGLANQIDVYDGLADTVDCVAAADGDVAIADEIGVDAISNCETTDNAPQTSIDTGPADGATVDTATPTYGLSADEIPTMFEVKIDAGSFQVCAASCTVPSLANGLHTLAFRAIDGDENLHADLTPATRAVTVAVPSSSPSPPPADTTAPETAIASHPKAKTKNHRASFAFASSEPGSSFLCSYDGKPYAPCTSPFTTPKLKLGKHRFDVVSTDPAANRDQSAATFLWKIVKRRKR